jgi:NADH-quinone oxidoreductase subunit K
LEVGRSGVSAVITLNHYLWVSGLLFALGIAGVVIRRNALVIFMALEMNLNAANLALIAFSKYNKIVDGQVLVFFIIAIAAAEVAVGLAIIVALFRRKQTVSVDELNSMRL